MKSEFVDQSSTGLIEMKFKFEFPYDFIFNPKVEKAQNFERFISSLTPIYSPSGGINRLKSIAIFLSFYAIGSIKQIICLFVTADDETLILLGDPFQPFGENRLFLDILIAGWIVLCFINFLADTYNRNARATIFWSKQMASLFEEFPLPSWRVDKVHHLGYDDYIDVCNKFRLVIRYARFTSLMSVLSVCGYMTPTMIANPDYWLINLNWTLFYIIAGTISILRLIIYPCIFLICVYTFNYKLTHIFVPLKINQLSKIDENTLIPVRETNTISDMKIMAKLYKEMFTYNKYWSVVNGFGHCMSFMINSYILYPIFFIPSTLITRLICVYWTILCLLWFAFPYLTVSYMNFKISRVNKRIFSKIKDLANPFEGIRLMVTMEHISEFKGFSIFTFHEPSYISFVYQSLDLITYFCLFIQNLGRAKTR